jgi:hypothetical protein
MSLNLLGQRIPFDLTCFYSPSEDSSSDENGNNLDEMTQNKTGKRRVLKRKSKQVRLSLILSIKKLNFFK